MGPLLVLIALDLWFFLPFLLRRMLLDAGDVILQNFPLAVLLNRGLREGSIPYWSDYNFCGYPVHADPQASFFNPVNLFLHGRLDPLAAFTLALALHHFALMAGTFLLGRRLGLSRGPSTLGAVVMGFCGYTTGHLIHQNILFSLPYLPLLMTAAVHYSNPRRDDFLREICFSAILIGLLVLSGHPQTTVIILIAWAAFKVWLHVARQDRDPGSEQTGRTLFWSLLSPVLLGMGLSALQLLPTLELFGMSQRSVVAAAGERAEWSFGLDQLVLLLFPYLTGTMREAAPYYGKGLLHEFSVYVGIVPLMLVWMLPGGPARRGETRFFMGLTLGGLLLALGPVSPLFFVHHLPPFAHFRNPCRFLLLFDLGLALWAAHAFQALLDRDWSDTFSRRLLRRRPRRLLLYGLLFAAVAYAGSWLAARGAGTPAAGGRTTVVRPTAHSDVFLDRVRSDTGARMALTLRRGAIRGVGIAITAAVAMTLITLYFEGQLVGGLLVVYLLGFTMLDLVGIYAYQFWDRVPIDRVMDETRSLGVNWLRHQPNVENFRVHVVPFRGRHPALDWVGQRTHLSNILSSIPMVGGYSPLTPSNWVDFFRSPDRSPETSPYNRELQVMARLDPIHDLWKLSLANCRYVIAPDTLEPGATDSHRLKPIFPQVYQNTEALGPAYLVRKLHPLGSGGSRWTILEELNRSLPTVIVDDPEHGAVVASAVTVAGESIFAVRPGPGRLSLLVHAKAPGYVVVPSLHYPGWQAHIEVDGRADEVAIMGVNGVFIGVSVPAGVSTLKLSFEPVAFREGLTISIATGGAVLFGLFGLLYGSLRHRRALRRDRVFCDPGGS